VDEIGEILKYILGGGVTLLAIAILLVLLPEKIETWVGLIWRFISNCGILVNMARRRYVRHDLQGRVNAFLKSIQKGARYLTYRAVKLEWVDSSKTTRDTFLRDDKLIIRLKQDDPNDQNFVHSAYLFISTSLLSRTKQYLSMSQRQAVDLYVTGKLLESQKPSTVSFFMSEYLHPQTDKGKIREYFDQFTAIDEHGFFYPVFLQELDFLGNKVFGKLLNNAINKEFNDLADFLQALSFRVIGDTTVPLGFYGDYCRFYVCIVGKRWKVDTEPQGRVYVRHLQGNQEACKAETLYLIGSWDNRHTMETIAKCLCDTHESLATQKIHVVLHFDGKPAERHSNCLIILRRKGIPIFNSSLQEPIEPAR